MDTDIAIVGGGLAGSTAAAMLGRAGRSVVLVDPHTTFPPDFRCEKLDGPQVAILRKTGLADAVLRAATHDGEAWVMRYGRIVERRRSDQHGIRYEDLVNTIRAEIPTSVTLVQGKVSAISSSPGLQTICTACGRQITARLVILANGLNHGLRQALGMARQDLSPCHSITIGFDLKPTNRTGFDFRAFTAYGERTADRIAYLTVFPIGPIWRANLMTYRGMDDLWLRAFRHQPVETLRAALPGAGRLLGEFDVLGPVKIRPADLYQTTNISRAGVVAVGDAFATSCPAAGTGAGKVFNDVERLCNVHIPRWMATDGMGEDKVATFYHDLVKQAFDRRSLEKAFALRSLSVDTGLQWRARRLARFAAGLLRQPKAALASEIQTRLRMLAGTRSGLPKAT